METLSSLLTGSGTATTMLYVSLTAFIGVLIGKIEVKKVKIGIAGVLFSGLLFGHLGAQPDIEVLHFVREFGLILFVYAIGIDVGPRFIGTLRNDGLALNLFAVSIALMGFGIAYLFYYFGNVPAEVITGIMSGAVTNTPGLGAAQQVLVDVGRAKEAAVSGMAYAVAYPLGVMGLILAMIVIRIFFKVKVAKEVENYNNQLHNNSKKLESVEISLTNPNLYGKEVRYIKKVIDKDIVLSRLKRNGSVSIIKEDDVLQAGDVLFGVSEESNLENVRLKIGDVKLLKKRDISGDLAMFHVLFTNRKLAGKTIEQIGIYRRYEANITRIFRAGMEILPTRETIVEFGDTVRVVGRRDLLPDIRNELGNSIKELAAPNIIPVFVGIFLGVLLGSIPIFIPGLPAPAKLGLAGGPLVVAIIFGHMGRIRNFNFYMTPGANMMIREMGIILFLSCVGLSSGGQFVNTLVNGGYVWVGYGAVITIVPVLIVGIVARMLKFNYLKICGFVSGAMTDPPALEYANSLAQNQAQSTAYAAVYPLSMFLRILLGQALVLITLS